MFFRNESLKVVFSIFIYFTERKHLKIHQERHFQKGLSKNLTIVYLRVTTHPPSIFFLHPFFVKFPFFEIFQLPFKDQPPPPFLEPPSPDHIFNGTFVFSFNLKLKEEQLTCLSYSKNYN